MFTFSLQKTSLYLFLHTAFPYLFSLCMANENAVNYYFQTVGNTLKMYITKYEKNILAGDFNAEVSEVNLSNFLDNYGLKSIVHERHVTNQLKIPLV